MTKLIWQNVKIQYVVDKYVFIHESFPSSTMREIYLYREKENLYALTLIATEKILSQTRCIAPKEKSTGSHNFSISNIASSKFTYKATLALYLFSGLFLTPLVCCNSPQAPIYRKPKMLKNITFGATLPTKKTTTKSSKCGLSFHTLMCQAFFFFLTMWV